MDRLTDPARLEALAATGLLDTPPEEDFDRLTRMAARLLRAPVSLVSLVDDRRQFFKSVTGTLREPWATMRQTPLSHSFCKHVVAEAAPLVVTDARKHPLVRENLAIGDLGVVAYLGMPLETAAGQPLGSFCVIDGESRDWSDEDVAMVRELADIVVDRIELRLLGKVLHESYLALRQLEMQRDEMVHMLVHDLRNPMTSFIGGLDVLDSAPDLPEKHRRFVQMALRGGEGLLSMIGNILDISKAEAGRMTLDLGECSASGLVAAAREQVTHIASSRGVSIETRVAPGLPALRVDEHKIRRVLVNLVSNAIQHSPANGRVVVSADADEAQAVRFSVTDAGRGIPLEAFGKIFEKYGQAATKKFHGASTGLGLPFSRMAVEAHGGRIQVESELGQGTRFYFTIPTGS